MARMSPSAFTKLYRNLAVVNPSSAATFLKAAVGGSIPETATAAPQLIAVVDLNEYVLLKPGNDSHLDARYELLTKMQHDFAKKKSVSVTVMTIDGGSETKTFTSMTPELSELVRYPFVGKGSPEAAQVALQLASFYGLTKDFQTYCDTNLGLDCNGFVGNYLRRVVNREDWNEAENKNGIGPNALIDSIMRLLPGTFVTKIEDIKATNTYVIALAHENGKIVTEHSGKKYGHIGISDFTKGSPTPLVKPPSTTSGPASTKTAEVPIWVVDLVVSANACVMRSESQVSRQLF
jgi:hypothetical protein